ncbi:hypothetical protein BH11PLA2_BH11PLA2_44500 [soil metagenome]
MTAIAPTVHSGTGIKSGGRRFHRLTCVLAGGMALVGGILALAVHPGFAALAAFGGVWLIVVPEPRGC